MNGKPTAQRVLSGEREDEPQPLSPMQREARTRAVLPSPRLLGSITEVTADHLRRVEAARMSGLRSAALLARPLVDQRRPLPLFSQITQSPQTCRLSSAQPINHTSDGPYAAQPVMSHPPTHLASSAHDLPV